jgi:hypothetical protein
MAAATALPAPTPAPAPAGSREDMLLLVDFKWLMAGLGWWVDLNRWRRDAGYVRECLDRGCSSPSVPLQRCVQQLRSRALALGGLQDLAQD